jgi:hypothetical protein
MAKGRSEAFKPHDAVWFAITETLHSRLLGKHVAVVVILVPPVHYTSVAVLIRIPSRTWAPLWSETPYNAAGAQSKQKRDDGRQCGERPDNHAEVCHGITALPTT